jgi:hypothetical protein
MNMRTLQRLALAFLVSLAGACATGPRFDAVEKDLRPLAADKSRIWFYRTGVLGAAITPDIRLNGTVVGTAVSSGTFFVDRDPGNMEVVAGSEVEKKVTFTTEAGDTRYVRMAVGLGVIVYRIIPELVDEAMARHEMAGLTFTGGKVAAPEQEGAGSARTGRAGSAGTGRRGRRDPFGAHRHDGDQGP